MYYCPKCGNFIGNTAMISDTYGENPETIRCAKCNTQLSIKLPYAPPLRQHSALRIVLGIISLAGLVSGFILMVYVWSRIDNPVVSFLSATGIVILSLTIFLLSMYVMFKKQKNPYAHGYNASYGMERRLQLEKERALLLKSLCVLNGIFIAVSYFIAMRHFLI
jgi:hypothetical protein